MFAPFGGVVVSWSTDTKTEALVQCYKDGNTSQPSLSKMIQEMKSDHSVVFDNLKIGSTYDCVVTAQDDNFLQVAEAPISFDAEDENTGVDKPDLIITHVSYETSEVLINNNEYVAIKLNVSFKNEGSSQMNGISTRFYLSVVGEENDYYPEGYNSNVLKENGDYIPIDTFFMKTVGTYLLPKGKKLDSEFTFYIDSFIENGVVNEGLSNTVIGSNENNNLLTKKITIDPVELNCVDSDGGKNYYIKGETSKIINDYTVGQVDKCSGDFIVEAYCGADNKDGNDYKKAVDFKCSNGCSNGACIVDDMVNNKNIEILNSQVPNNTIRPDSRDDVINMTDTANLLLEEKLDEVLTRLGELQDTVREQNVKIKYLTKLSGDLEKLSKRMENAINSFVTYGVDANTKKLGEGERAAVIHSYKTAFNKLPGTEEELADVIKIANGRWPSITNDEAEKRAKEHFQKIYKRIADMNDPKDNAAVTVMAYGLRQKAENRNLDSEKTGIKTFKAIYGYNPSTTEDWNTMQVITYSGASRGVDTDGDGHLDGLEVANGFDPLKK